MIDKGAFDKWLIWNSSKCKCECEKSCDVSEDLENENCKCRKKSVDKLDEECTETVKEVKLAEMTSTEDENIHQCGSCTVYFVSFLILFQLTLELGAIFFIFIGT